MHVFSPNRATPGIPLFISSEFAGQSFTQLPHPMHFSVSIIKFMRLYSMYDVTSLMKEW